MVQTPTQRKANLKFAAVNQSKQGKSEAQLQKKELTKKKQKSPISKGWLYLLVFILIGGFLIDALFRIFAYFGGK